MTNETNEEVDEEQAEEQDEEDVVIQRTGTELARPAYATHGYNPARDDMFGRWFTMNVTTTEEMVSDYEYRVLRQFTGFTEASLYDSDDDCDYWYERSQRRFDELMKPRVGDEIEMYVEQTDEIEGVTQWGSVVYVDNREMVRVNEDVNETTSGVLIPEDLAQVSDLLTEIFIQSQTDSGCHVIFFTDTAPQI